MELFIYGITFLAVLVGIGGCMAVIARSAKSPEPTRLEAPSQNVFEKNIFYSWMSSEDFDYESTNLYDRKLRDKLVLSHFYRTASWKAECPHLERVREVSGYEVTCL